MAAPKRASRSAHGDGGAPRAPQAYNGAIRAQLADLQRARLLSAMFDVATERGAANVTVAHIVERSGVSRRTFYEAFRDREECFLAAFEQALALASQRVLAAYESQSKWRERIRAALGALLTLLDEEPVIGRLLIVEALSGGARTLVSTSGKTSRANGASLDAKLAYPKTPQGTETNIAKVKVDLPKQLPSRLTTLQKACLAATFETDPAACPAPSRIGVATATTPILPVPLNGPVYFVSHGGEAFPDLVIVLQGYGVTVNLVGTTFINKAGITSTTFKTIPDVPVGSFELKLPQGPYSALAANGNLCTTTKTKIVKRKVRVKSKGHTRTITRKTRKQVASLLMPAAFVAQDGAEIHQNTPIEVTGCGRAKHKAKRARARRGPHPLHSIASGHASRRSPHERRSPPA